MRATAPSGQVAFEGRVGWSGELGFGVRAPEQGQTAPGPLEPTVDPADGAAHHGHGDHGHGSGGHGSGGH
jgi:NADH-quinone oxidoreductase subunit I